MRVLFVFLIFFLSGLTTTLANVIGIDFASDSMKIAIVKPGHPLEIGKFLSGVIGCCRLTLPNSNSH